MKTKISIFFFILLIATLFMFQLVEAHRGRTDSSGGHTNKKTGEYHYHSKKSSSSGTNTEKKTNIKSTKTKRATTESESTKVSNSDKTERKSTVSKTKVSKSEVTQDKYIVTDVVDGDTIKVKKGNVVDTVRIAGIDAPEVNQRYSSEAKEITKSLVGREVELKNDGKQKNRDKYSRLLRYVEVDNQDFGAKLVKEGYAKAYDRIKSDRLDNYKGLESQAKTNNAGLWGK